VTIADAPPASAPTPQDQPMVLSQSSDELPKCVVPSVRRGVTLNFAKRRLRRANCDARVVKRRSSVRRGRVIGLVTKAGSVRKPGTRIGVRVSSGRR
jgi:beta-lactam-binding protein with PASTA domain